MIKAIAKLRENFVINSNTYEEELKSFHKEEIRKATRRGKKDGRYNKPPKDRLQLTSVEREIYTSYASKMSELAIDMEGLLTVIREDYIASIDDTLSNINPDSVADEVHFYQEECKSELNKVEDQYHEDLNIINQDPDLTALIHQYEEIDDHYEDYCDELERRDSNIVWNISTWVYSIILVLIGLSEVAAIYNAFLNFEEPPLTTWVWAIGFGLILALMAHFNGVLLSKGKESKISLGLGLSITILILIVIYFVSTIRTAGMPDIPIKYMSLPVFVILSYVIYIAGVGLAFLTHDSNPSFVRSIKDRIEKKEKMNQKKKELHLKKEALHNKLQTTENAIHIKYNDKIAQVKSTKDSLHYLKHDATSLYDDILVGLRNLEKLTIDYYKEAIEVYRSSNTQYRKEEEPTYWSSPIMELTRRFNHIEELDAQTNQGLWHYNPN